MDKANRDSAYHKLSCCDAKDRFETKYSEFRIRNLPRTIKIRRGYTKSAFDGDKVIGSKAKSPDYIVFVYSKKTIDCLLFVIEVHEVSKEVIEKKNGFEQFWQKEFSDADELPCSDYEFILIKQRGGLPRVVGLLKEHGIKVMGKVELPL